MQMLLRRLFLTILSATARSFNDCPARESRQHVWAWFAIVAMIVAGLLATPFARTPVVIIPHFMAMVGSAMLSINLILAVLLSVRGRIEQRGDSVRLGIAYLYVFVLIIPQVASFPGGLTEMPLIGTDQTSLWIEYFRHVGFALAIIRYAWFASQPIALESSSSAPALLTVAAAAAATTVSVHFTGALPTLLVDGHYVLTGPASWVWASLGLIALAALASVARLRNTNSERSWLLVGLVAGGVEVWLDFNAGGLYTLGWYLATLGSLFASLAMLISLIHDSGRLYSEAAETNARLQDLARIDGLTGIANRRRFDELLEEEFRRASRQELPLALVLLDIDWFKPYNDSYGHPAGDDCLRRVSAAVADALRRPGDHAARYGGEEIAILLPATGDRGAAVVAERVRAAVSALGIAHTGSRFGVVTVSAGVASVLPANPGDTAASLVSAADRALYQAKRDGRNLVRTATTGIHGADLKPYSYSFPEVV